MHVLTNPPDEDKLASQDKDKHTKRQDNDNHESRRIKAMDKKHEGRAEAGR
jgi:hypothetical protein